MNDQKLERKILQDVAKVKKDLGILAKDSAARLGGLENNASQATDDLSKWAKNGISQLSEGFEKMTGSTKGTVASAAATVKKDVGVRLSQYNAKAREVAAMVPNGFGKKAIRYPWVTISIVLMVGFVLGNFLKPARLPLG